MRLRAYLALLRPHAPLLGVAGALLGVTGAAPGLAVWLLRSALDALSRGDAASLAPVAGAFVALAALQAAAGLVRAAITRRVSASVASGLRRRLHEAYLREGAGEASGDRLSALTDEVDQVQYGVSALVTAVRNPVALASLAAVAIGMAPSLALPTAGVLLAAFALGGSAARLVRRATVRARRARASMAALISEQLAGGEVIRAHGAEAAEAARLAALDDEDRRARWQLDVIRLVPSSAVEVLAAIGLALVLLFGAARVAEGTVEAPALVALVVAVLLASRPLAGLAEVWSLTQRSLAALDRVDRALSIPAPPRGTRVLPAGPVGVRWEGTTVRRGGRAIVDAVTLEVEPGELVALIGPSGAGKTTLLRLASGAVAPDEGEVRIGGVPVAEIDPDELRAAVAVVPQDGALFARSVAENVALGEAPDPERVVAALRAAGAGFVLGWPQGVRTVLRERAAGLSGGERQRLAIARALYRRARVVLLDEPTASLDRQTASAVLDTLRGLREGRALVVATHDPAVVAAADRAVALGDGRIEPEGGIRWTGSSAS